MIDILLSTYNGEQYVAEQLDSLLAQSYGDFNIIVRDDCSRDKTVEIVGSYASLHPDKIKLIRGEKNLGYIKSFEQLLTVSTADYYMFCDQDDVWLPDKIALSFKRLNELEAVHGKDTPILVHTDLTVTDTDLNTTHKSFVDYSGFNIPLLESDIHFLGLCNTVTGCTTLFNRALKEKALPFNTLTYHDAWLAICAKKYGVLSFIPQQTILYRQHDNNSLGALDGSFSLKDKLRSLGVTIRKITNVYRSTRLIVYRNPLQFIYYKTLYTIRYRMFKNK